MPEYIDLGKSPESEQERHDLIMEIIKSDEVNEQEGLNIIQKNVFDFLTTQKGFPPHSISANKRLRVLLPDVEFIVPVDLLVTIDDTFVMAIKCAINSVDSWERYSLALGRTVLDDYQIPFAVVSDSQTYILIDVLKGEVVARDKQDIPEYEALRNFINNNGRPLPYNKEKLVRERRILHAFNAIRCSEGICD
ncbi:MAG: hypothetical protein N3A62_05050 [Thermodesulfovibrionales bacterium]|nr:hypothetical protein [Thermodesulfovibrionales bacterium]